jgi:hypothetical protein
MADNSKINRDNKFKKLQLKTINFMQNPFNNYIDK